MRGTSSAAHTGTLLRRHVNRTTMLGPMAVHRTLGTLGTLLLHTLNRTTLLRRTSTATRRPHRTTLHLTSAARATVPRRLLRRRHRIIRHSPRTPRRRTLTRPFSLMDAI
jgi:hypothetical protein